VLTALSLLFGDMLARKCEYETSYEFEVPKKLLDLVNSTLIELNYKVKIQGQLSNIYREQRGLHKMILYSQIHLIL
jgi:hypothetical protein